MISSRRGFWKTLSRCCCVSCSSRPGVWITLQRRHVDSPGRTGHTTSERCSSTDMWGNAESFTESEWEIRPAPSLLYRSILRGRSHLPDRSLAACPEQITGMATTVRYRPPAASRSSGFGRVEPSARGSASASPAFASERAAEILRNSAKRRELDEDAVAAVLIAAGEALPRKSVHLRPR